VNLIRSHELNEAQRRAADCAAALREVYDPQPPEAAHAVTELQNDRADDAPRRMPEGGLIALLLACAAVAGCWALAVYAPR
jgi:hypothetical protein